MKFVACRWNFSKIRTMSLCRWMPSCLASDLEPPPRHQRRHRSRMLLLLFMLPKAEPPLEAHAADAMDTNFLLRVAPALAATRKRSRGRTRNFSSPGSQPLRKMVEGWPLAQRRDHGVMSQTFLRSSPPLRSRAGGGGGAPLHGRRMATR